MSIALASTPLAAKGLKDLKPPQEEDIEKAKEAIEKLPGKEELEKAKKKVKELKKEPKKVTQYNRLAILDANLAYTSLKGSKGDWSSGFSADLRLGVRYLQLMNKKLDLYGTYHYIPVDVLVEENFTEYQGVVEAHLFGTTARYALKDSLHIVAHAEIGLAQSILKPYGAPINTEDMEESGGAALVGGGAQWKILDDVWIGTYLAVGAGTFTFSQFGFSTHLTL